MIKVKGEMFYEEDLTEEQKKILDEKETKFYPNNHMGLKIVEATLHPSARVGNNESNRLRIIKYCNQRGYQGDIAKNRGFGKLDLIFRNIKDANNCLKDNHTSKIVDFVIPNRAKTIKGLTTGWDNSGTLDKLYEAITNKESIIKLEKIIKRSYDRDSNNIREYATDAIIITYEGTIMPN